MTRVAVLGTGIMGSGMAGSMARAGLDVTAWNRSPDKAKPLSEHGIRVVGDLAEAVADADLVVTSLFDTTSVLDVAGVVVDGLPAGAIWVQSSTIGLDGTRRAVELATAHDVAFLDAPVLGTRQPAESGALVVLVSGDAALRARTQPVFDAIGSRTVVVGDRPGQASALKLVMNAWIASLTAALGQSLALARGLGLPPELFLDTLRGTPTDTAYAHAKGDAILSGDTTTSFAVDGVVKDVGLIRDAAVQAGVPTDLLDAVLDSYQRARDAGLGGHDMAHVHEAFVPRSS